MDERSYPTAEKSEVDVPPAAVVNEPKAVGILRAFQHCITDCIHETVSVKESACYTALPHNHLNCIGEMLSVDRGVLANKPQQV